MAKSLRSKWKRKMRAVKRERYGKKELEKLKLIIESATTSEADMNEVKDIMNVVKKSDINKKTVLEEMDIENEDKISNEAQNGFPVWMSSHRKKKIIKINKKLNKQKKKLLKKEKKKFKR